MVMGTVFQIVSWIVAGAIAGWLASMVLRVERQGCLINIVIGIAGAIVGGFVKQLLFPYLTVGWSFLDTLISAIIGSIVLLIVIELIVPGKQLGTRRARRRRR